MIATGFEHVAARMQVQLFAAALASLVNCGHDRGGGSFNSVPTVQSMTSEPCFSFAKLFCYPYCCTLKFYVRNFISKFTFTSKGSRSFSVSQFCECPKSSSASIFEDVNRQNFCQVSSRRHKKFRLRRPRPHASCVRQRFRLQFIFGNFFFFFSKLSIYPSVVIALKFGSVGRPCPVSFI